MFTIAHLSDVHLALRTTPSFGELANKRLTGFVNLKGNRSSHHQDWALAALIDDLKRAAPDHIALTGDMINLALGDEFVHAHDWLKDFGKADWISLVPGNHDTYVRRKPHEGIDLWQDYMRGDTDAGKSLNFPYLRRRRDIAVVGLSSAITTMPFMATGELGRRQLIDAENLLASLGSQNLCRIVLIHHPPLEGLCSRHKRLLDAEAFAQMIARNGAELILHGHNHTDTLVYTPGPKNPVPVVGVPSGSSLGHGEMPAAQYNLIDISKSNGGWKLNMKSRRLNLGKREFADLPLRCLSPHQNDADT